MTGFSSSLSIGTLVEWTQVFVHIWCNLTNDDCGTKLSPLVNVVGSNSNKELISLLCGTDTNLYTGPGGSINHTIYITMIFRTIRNTYIVNIHYMTTQDTFYYYNVQGNIAILCIQFPDDSRRCYFTHKYLSYHACLLWSHVVHRCQFLQPNIVPLPNVWIWTGSSSGLLLLCKDRVEQPVET